MLASGSVHFIHSRKSETGHLCLNRASNGIDRRPFAYLVSTLGSVPSVSCRLLLPPISALSNVNGRKASICCTVYFKDFTKWMSFQGTSQWHMHRLGLIRCPHLRAATSSSYCGTAQRVSRTKRPTAHVAQISSISHWIHLTFTVGLGLHRRLLLLRHSIGRHSLAPSPFRHTWHTRSSAGHDCSLGFDQTRVWQKARRAECGGV